MGERVRLHKWLAQAGVASRRASEALIRQGRVAVNGQTVTAMGWSIDPGRDRVTVDGRPVAPPPGAGEMVYILLHKPRGLVSTARDERGRPTVVDWVRSRGGPGVRLFPVGRVDLDSEGLLLLTNDGELAYALTHPSRQVPKTYRVTVRGAITDEALQRLRQGVELEDGRARASSLRLIRRSPDGGELAITLHEGRKRQVRRMCQSVGLTVRRLVRVRLGPLDLGTLAPGQWRYLGPDEVARLRRASGASEPFTAPGGRGSIPPKTQDGRTAGDGEPGARGWPGRRPQAR
ncbi:MAG: rRNA pseudouridine synthase [Firmicutes bacterium]|nr:rRNA pseudouridine synthase [Bacillota bacterium]